MSNYVTAIGLDVHARSISACAFDPMTGEVTRARFGYDPASVAEWVLGFESPKAVYESGPTGFHLCRALRALGVDCAVGAVSKMHRPAADRGRKNDRRDAEWLAGLLACRNVVEVWVPDDRTEAARDLSRALEDARDDLQRARQRMSEFLLRHGLAFDETTPAGRRRSNWTEAYWRWARSIEFGEADDAAAYEHYMDAVERCAGAKRELERRDGVARRDHPRRQRPRPARAGRGVLARPDVDEASQEAEAGPRGRGGRVEARREVQPSPAGQAGRHVPGGQETVRGELRDGPRDGLLGLGDSAHGPVAPAAPWESDPGGSPRPRPLGGRSRSFSGRRETATPATRLRPSGGPKP